MSTDTDTRLGHRHAIVYDIERPRRHQHIYQDQPISHHYFLSGGSKGHGRAGKKNEQSSSAKLAMDRLAIKRAPVKTVVRETQRTIVATISG